jgi:hypothetical protein
MHPVAGRHGETSPVKVTSTETSSAVAWIGVAVQVAGEPVLAEAHIGMVLGR